MNRKESKFIVVHHDLGDVVWKNMFSVCVGRGGVHFLLTEGCSDLFGEIARLKRSRSLYGLKQASRSLHCHLAHGIKCVGFRAECCLRFCLAFGRARRCLHDGGRPRRRDSCYWKNSRCNQLDKNLTRCVPCKCVGFRFSHDTGSGTRLQIAGICRGCGSIVWWYSQ